ncbi:3-hydroxyacyl-ACP dehydratase FabZ family protein [Bacillus cereus]|uniref:Beta-hydroxyacyl-ACP dehydratase n=1 Tax=Bacillus cereus TaxID=1396 RepID=A0AA44Q6U7_BACCE|nr:hypothetical protein [Bacillus cereus]PFM99767.1 hypothetical protein COJ55_25785 [Bacillus cereus]PFR92625.1 hypothetical protein COK38_22370 [Bacillus cereus]
MNISELSPSRKPWLMIDKIMELTQTTIVTKKNITNSDYFLEGHFPNYSIFPGMLLLEGVIQSINVFFTIGNIRVKGQAQSVKSRFLKPVIPGDTVIYDVQMLEESNEEEFYFYAIGRVLGSAVFTTKLKFLMEDNQG